MAETLETLREIRSLVPSGTYNSERKKKGGCHAPDLKSWKQKGGRILGFQCVYIPEEIIHSTGILPVRLLGGAREMPVEEATAYLYHNCCSFIRSSLQLVINGHYDFLDGYVGGSNCDCTRRFYDVTTHYNLFPFTHIVYVPRKQHEGAEIYKHEIEKFIEAFERHFQVKVADQALLASIQIYEKTRALFRRLYDLRKSDACPITGSEVIDVYNAMFMMPREEFNRLLGQLVEEVSTTKRSLNGRVRLMITGSPLNNAEFIHVIEEEGAIVVVEELCTTSRYWWNSVQVNPGESPLDALCRRYLNNEPCARMKPPEERWESVLRRAKEWRVDGIVSQVVRNCASYLNDQPMLRLRLEGEGIPVLELDVEYGMAGTGQVKTRVQAFLEMIRGGQQ